MKLKNTSEARLRWAFQHSMERAEKARRKSAVWIHYDEDGNVEKKLGELARAEERIRNRNGKNPFTSDEGFDPGFEIVE